MMVMGRGADATVVVDEEEEVEAAAAESGIGSGVEVGGGEGEEGVEVCKEEGSGAPCSFSHSFRLLAMNARRCW